MLVSINRFIFFSLILIGFGLFACRVDHIEVSESRKLVPEHDKDLRIQGEINTALELLTSEITNSDDIESCQSGQKIINTGVDLIPQLMDHFSDSTKTKVYSAYNKRCLTRGEIAIILSAEIKAIPIAAVVGIQQCTPPFDSDIEHYLWRINEDQASFEEKYRKWIRKAI